MWFKDHLTDGKVSYAVEEVRALILSFIRRHDDELEELREMEAKRGRMVQRRRVEALEKSKRLEKDRFIIGFEAPNLCTVAGVRSLREWNGQIRTLPAIDMAVFRPT